MYIIHICVYTYIYIYLTYLLPNSSCYTLCSLVPQTTVFTTFSERYAIRKVHSDLFFIRSGTRIISPTALYRDDDRTQQDGYARDNVSHRDGSYGSARYRSFSVERGVHNPTHDGLLGTAPRLIMHRSASFSFRRYC